MHELSICLAMAAFLCSGCLADRKAAGWEPAASGDEKPFSAQSPHAQEEAVGGKSVSGTVPGWHTRAVHTPVTTARRWTSAVAPNPRGGSNYIAQYWNHGNDDESEWIVVDLDSNMQFPSIHLNGYSTYRGADQLATQARAANGRIFFGVNDNRMNYYDPINERIVPILVDDGLGGQSPHLIQLHPGGLGDKNFFSTGVGPDGYLYATTQSRTSSTSLIRLHPDTLTYETFSDIGANSNRSLTYGYYHQVDPPYVYVAVGQGQWELWSIDVETGAKQLMPQPDGGWAERTGAGAFISFNNRPGGIVATLRSARAPGDPSSGWVGNSLFSDTHRSDYYWCVQGQLVPALASQNEPPLPHDYPTYDTIDFGTQPGWLDNPLPEIDTDSLNDDMGRSFVFNWRPNASAAWREAAFDVEHTAPIGLESFTPLSDGTALGNTVQYNGWYRFDPSSNTSEYYGKHGPSQARTLVVDDQVYISGYPSGQLWRYDPARPWTSTAATQNDDSLDQNPRYLGNYRDDSGVHYPYYLLDGGNDRIYMAGRRERDAVGSGIGFYDVSTQTFAGSSANLATMKPRGLVLLPNQGAPRLVFSGELRDGETGEAQLVLLDLDLVEQERITLEAGLTHTGNLASIGHATRFIGRIPGENTTRYYLYDLQTRQIVHEAVVTGQGSVVIRRNSENTYWAIIDQELNQIDTETLQLIPVARFTGEELSTPRWLDNSVLGQSGAQLLRAQPMTISHWRFDEGAGTTAQDSGPAGNDASFLFGTGWSNDAVIGGGAVINGTNDQINIDGSVVDQKMYSVSLWFRTSETQPDYVYWEGSNGAGSMGIRLNDPLPGDIKYTHYHASGVPSESSFLYFQDPVRDINDGAWHHVVAMRAGPTSFSLYVDGELVDSTSAVVENADVGYTFMGRINSGELDDVRIYNGPLDETTIKFLFKTSPHTLSSWTFDDVVGTTAPDTGAAANHGTLRYGAVPSAQGLVGNALEMTGWDSRAEVAPALANLHAYTLSMWLQTEETVADVCFLELASGSPAGVHLRINDPESGDLRFQHLGPTGAGDDTASMYYLQDGAASINDGQWHHIVVVRDGPTDFYLYVDGVLVDSSLGTNVGGGDTLSLGYLGRFHSGRIDEVRLFDGALDTESVRYLYARPGEP